MTTLQYIAAIAAVVVALWPQIKRLGVWAGGALPPPPPPAGPEPSYSAAINHLAQVRLRLRLTQTLDDERKKAIDVLTLALVDGSDQ
jgi:hypothetical protein